MLRDWYRVDGRWMKKSPAARALALYSLADNLDKRSHDMAASVHNQTGLSMEEAAQEVELSISRLSDWAARCDKQNGHVPVRNIFLSISLSFSSDSVLYLCVNLSIAPPSHWLRPLDPRGFRSCGRGPS